MRFIKVLKIVFVIVLFFSSSKIYAQSASKLYESFWVGEKGTMYYVKPLNLNVDKNQSINIDFTFTFLNEPKDSVQVKFSVLQKDNDVQNINKMSIENPNHKVDFKNVKLMFKEKNDKKYLSRYEAKIDINDFILLLANSDWAANINDESYKSKNKTKKHLSSLKNYFFFLYE